MENRFKNYRNKRQLAHKILAELIPQKDAEFLKKHGIHYFITDNQGRTLYHDSNIGLIKLERCYVDFRSLKVILKSYTELQIEQALQILVGNEHIEIEDKLKPTTTEMVSFSISPKGRLAYDDESYLNEPKWSDTHPVGDKIRTGAITFVFTLISGILLYIATVGRKTQAESQQNKQLHSLTDSVANHQKRINSAQHK
jgi:hypothetical protein